LASDSFLDPIQFVPLLGIVVGMMVGLVGIWNTIKARQAETKRDIEQSSIASEIRLKEFFEARFKIVDVQFAAISQRIDRQVGDLKERIDVHSESLSKHIAEREVFFKEWIQRIEDEIDPYRHDRTRRK